MKESTSAGTNLVELSEVRRRLQESVRTHRESVNFFASSKGFHRVALDVTSDPPLDKPQSVGPWASGEEIKGITTAFTCFESLNEALNDPSSDDPIEYSGFRKDDLSRFLSFSEIALSHIEDWKSEGAARNYCIVRATSPAIRLLKQYGADRLGSSDLDLNTALREVWDIVKPTPEESGIFESKYPPNAFLTYWGIKSLLDVGELEGTYRESLGIVEIWLKSVIGREIAKQAKDVHSKDPQQLAWAICGLLIVRPSSIADRSEGTPDLIDVGLRCFFEQQLPTGSWDTGRALFHYPEAGNAYCYIFETLGELVELSLDRRLAFSDELRNLLSPYIPRLINAYDHLETTKRALGGTRDGRVGWSSGHHPHRTSPESWATATAFRFMQSLRRLVGFEARKLALLELRAQKLNSTFSSSRKPGDTWDTGFGPVGLLLEELFVNPSIARLPESDLLDPDRPRLSQDWARSAILYGPPGTGKTSLARMVAKELAWEFIEITPADVLDRGTAFVSARTDEVFRTLFEIDGAVVLFDEIDELIRLRKESDMLGRFFTTTMLPRLARLWDARKLIFFVNTNSIQHVDPAIRRSQRFDAAIYVLPPSFHAKTAFLPSKLRGRVKEDFIRQILTDYGTPGKAASISPEQAKLSWLTFIRLDQLDRLKANVPETIDELRGMLQTMGMQMFADWALAYDGAEPALDVGNPDDCLKWMLDAYRKDLAFQRVDESLVRRVEVQGV